MTKEAPAGTAIPPEHGPQKGLETVDKVRIAQTTITSEEPEHDTGDRLYDVLAAMPFEERIEAIHRMAERMGV